MINYLNTVQSLLTQVWYWPLLFLLSLGIYYFKKTPPVIPNKNNNFSVWLAALLTYIVLSAPYWMLRQDAPHGGSDDAAMTLQTYLSASLRGDSINWTNSMLGGIDRWLLPNCHPLSLGRIYALFLKEPYQLYLFIIAINVISVFIFSWKIQVEFLGMRRWMAYIGAMAAVLTEGYWLGKFSDAHVSNGHGFAVIIAGIYWLTRFRDSPKFWIVSMLVGLIFCMGSWIPFHNLPPLLVTTSIWGLIFWGRGAWLKVFQANILIIIVFALVLLPQILAMKLLYSITGRADIYRPTVHLEHFYSITQIILAGLLVVMGFVFNIFAQKTAKQVLLLFAGFCLVPAAAYLLEIIKIVPAFRWELMYAGNDAWIWLALVFFTDKIQQAIAGRWRFAGILTKLLAISVWWTLFIFTWMGSLWFDLDNSYPSGTWRALTDTSISSEIKKTGHQPMRVVGIDDTNDMHFWGQYQGLESMIGYTPFIDKDLLYFWWFTAMLPSTNGTASSTGIVSIPIPVLGHYQHLNFSVPLPKLIDPNALRLTNVDWIVSRHPLDPMPGLQIAAARPGQPAACANRDFPPTQIDIKSIGKYWDYIGCLFKDYRYQRPLYVYRLQDSLPRAYIAHRVEPWPSGQIPNLDPKELAIAAKGVAYVDYGQWLLYQDQTSSGTVDIDDYQSDYMHMRISTGQDALLVVASSLNPYWRILVDGKPVHPIEVNGFQTGIWVDPDDKNVQLIYCPPYRPKVHPYCSKA